MQIRLPAAMLRQIIREAFAHQNVTCVPAIHHPTRDIDPYAGNVLAGVSVPGRAGPPGGGFPPLPAGWVALEDPGELPGATRRAVRLNGERPRPYGRPRPRGTRARL